jgi:hypothetical protein
VTLTIAKSREQRLVRDSRRVIRVDADRKLVFGEVYVPFDFDEKRVYTVEEINDLVDTWGTSMRAATLAAFRQQFMEWSAQRIDVMHDRSTFGGKVIDSIPTELAEACGFTPDAWVMGVKVADSVWPRVSSRELTGFSFDAYAGRIRHEIRVRGKGVVPDLRDVYDPPFFPNETSVDGEAVVCLDELIELDSWACRSSIAPRIAASSRSSGRSRGARCGSSVATMRRPRPSRRRSFRPRCVSRRISPRCTSSASTSTRSAPRG